MINLDILETLKTLSDTKHAKFMVSLVPNIDSGLILGIKVPKVKALAKSLYSTPDGERFLNNLPHKYFDENNLHMQMINLEKDFNVQVELLQKFLPYIDNWATCDGFSSTAFKNNAQKLLPLIDLWFTFDKPYYKRFALLCLQKYFLTESFDQTILERAFNVVSEEYYVNMMVAWFFATALTKQYQKTLPLIESKKLSPFVQNKTIQKACESFAIPKDRKQYLKTLKI